MAEEHGEVPAPRADYVQVAPKFSVGDIAGYPTVSDARYRVDEVDAEVRTYGKVTLLMPDGTEIAQGRKGPDGGRRDLTGMTLLSKTGTCPTDPSGKPA